MDNEKKTERLRNWINNSPATCNISEDTQFIYFDAEDICTAMLLRQMHYDVWYQETKTGYHVRVLKPNWFSHDLLQEDKKL